MVSNLF